MNEGSGGETMKERSKIDTEARHAVYADCCCRLFALTPVCVCAGYV